VVRLPRKALAHSNVICISDQIFHTRPARKDINGSIAKMSGLKTGPATRGLQRFAIPFVCVLIGVQGYFSQWLFNSSPDLRPGPFTSRETYIFNGLLACVWYTYYKACTVDPGRYTVSAEPKSKSRPEPPSDPKPAEPKSKTPAPAPVPGPAGTRWCKKCSAPKPPRAHHCRHCGRCIPKMDHHCPWTGNCVSMQTFPYFLRFLLYTNVALWGLAFHIFQRLSAIWSDRNLPAYLGPTLPHLIALTLLSLVNLGTSLALGILLFTTLKSWALNTTMIEDWEIERHESVLCRLDASSSSTTTTDFWGADGDSGVLLAHLNRIEFPYDLGVSSNLSQAMGTRNPLLWVFPLARGPAINPSTPGKGLGWEWEENGFNDLPGLWPPPDPEKLRRAQSGWPGAASRMKKPEEDPYYVDQAQYETAKDAKAAFAARQFADNQRRQMQQQRWDIIDELEEVGGEREWEGEVAWTNTEGDTLWDYGVDEEVERDDGREHQQLIAIGEEEEDDDVPIAELIRRRKVLTKEGDE